MLEGETEEQESQETGKSDGSCGKSEKLVCLGLNETKWDMWTLPGLTSSPRTSVGENELGIGADERNGGGLMMGSWTAGGGGEDLTCEG